MGALLDTLGLNPQFLVAGFAGGVIHAIHSKAASPIAIIGAIVFGGFTANYFAEPMSAMLHWPNKTAAFAVGAVGMPFLQVIAKRILG